MGLFQQRPEEPTEWAGIPSDPAREETAAERLTNAAPLDIGLVGLLGETGGTVESIVIAVEPVPDGAEAPASDD